METELGVKLLEQRDLARQEIERLSGKVSGELKIGGSTIPGAYILPALIGKFRKKNPTVSVQLIIEDTARITEAVLDGGLCIGVVGAKVQDPRIETHAYLKDELVIAVPAGHPWARKKSVPPQALATEPFILREQGSGTLRIMEERLEKAGHSLGELNVVARVGMCPRSDPSPSPWATARRPRVTSTRGCAGRRTRSRRCAATRRSISCASGSPGRCRRRRRRGSPWRSAGMTS